LTQFFSPSLLYSANSFRATLAAFTFRVPSFLYEINVGVFFIVGMSLRALSNFLVAHAPFSKGVLHIVFLRSNPKVTWIYANPVVALVTDEHAARILKRCKLPAYSVRPHTLAVYRKGSVSGDFVNATGPLPASARSFSYQVPKSFFKWSHSCGG
jgi:hypothetical protein